jgi:hypothetical protein
MLCPDVNRWHGIRIATVYTSLSLCILNEPLDLLYAAECNTVLDILLVVLRHSIHGNTEFAHHGQLVIAVQVTIDEYSTAIITFDDVEIGRAHV